VPSETRAPAATSRSVGLRRFGPFCCAFSLLLTKSQHRRFELEPFQVNFLKSIETVQTTGGFHDRPRSGSHRQP
jgi:hypothetical protein